MKQWMIVPLVLMVCLGAYAFWGGFNKATVQELENKSFQIQGKLYEGSARDKKMDAQFNVVSELLNAHHTGEKLTAYYYSAPTKANDFKVKVFIGATYSGGSILSNDWEVRSFELGKCLQTQHKSHPLLSAVYRESVTYAKEKSYKLDSAIAVEQYPEKDNLILWIPIKK